jgi:putative hydroxymethylpyrimidine transport system substrate-binding protein
MEQVDEGLPLVMIGTLINNPLNTVVVMKDGPIHTTRDLAGKKIGYSGSSKNHVLVKILLEQDHLSLDTVTLINVRHGLTQALLSGKVDAVTGVMRNFEIPQIELAGKAVRTFDPEKNGMPTYSELIFVVHYPRADDTRYARFLTALAQGVAYLRQHPEETWRDFAKANPELNNELNRRAWFATLPYFAAKPTAFNAGAFMRYAEFMRQRGLIKSIQPRARYTTIKE